jgi:hypothetical protein
MSRITLRVTIHNESDARLVLINDHHEHGEFSAGQRPPGGLGPFETCRFQSEGSSVLDGPPTTGVQGSVRYRLEAQPTDGAGLFIHWNSPLVESDYGNTFEALCPVGWELTHWGGQGHQGELHVRLRRTALRKVPDFHPHGRAFRFTNTDWSQDLPVVSVGFLWNKLVERMPEPVRTALGILPIPDDGLPLTRADMGMCGGMVFAVMDYHNAHLLPPTDPQSPRRADDPLFAYIRDRLWDSFDTGGGGHRFLSYSSPHYPDAAGGVAQDFGLGLGRSWITYRETWQQIHQEIDSGRPVPLGLVHTRDLDLGQNHQVLAYGYERSGQNVTVHIYDPNEERQEPVKYHFNITSTDGDVRITREPGSEHAIWCMFRLGNYEPKPPPRGRRFTSVNDGLQATQGRGGASALNMMRSHPQSRGSLQGWLRSL